MPESHEAQPLAPSPSRRRRVQPDQADGEASADDASESTQDSQERPKKPVSNRLDFLDWMRLMLVFCVVFAHISVCGLKGGGTFDEVWLLDSRTLWSEPGFRESVPVASSVVDALAKAQEDPSLPSANLSSINAGPTDLTVRYVSLARQWCLPILFWISGAACGCSYRGGLPGGLVKLLGFSAVGMFSNAILWYTSPQDAACLPDTPACAGKGLLFDFSIAGRAGAWFAVLFQMWYTVALFMFTLASAPMFAVVHGNQGLAALLGHYVVTVLIMAALVLVQVGDCVPQPFQVLAYLAVLEAVFTGLLALDAPQLGRQWRLDWLPVRLVHYLMGVVTVLQFGWMPYSNGIQDIGPAYLSYICIGFYRCFHLGFVQTHARQGKESGGGPCVDRVDPLISRIWPLGVFIWIIDSPSTNWDRAGMLTYPFFPVTLDRVLYVVGSLYTIFAVDRMSRGVPCRPMPGTLANVSLVVYLFHPWFISVSLVLGLKRVFPIWFSTFAMGGGVVAVFELFQALAKGGFSSNSAAGSDDESRGSSSS